MSDSRKAAISFNIGPLFTLGIVFVVLKLCEVVDWSWWLVTAPFWLGWALLLVCMGVVFAFIGLVAIIAWWRDRQ